MELAQHKRLTIDMKVQVYFCDPQSPWQRGTNENTNRLLRQYFQKGTNLSRYSQADLNTTALRLNQHPRKTLGFQTPRLYWRPLLHSPPEPTGTCLAQCANCLARAGRQKEWSMPTVENNGAPSTAQPADSASMSWLNRLFGQFRWQTNPQQPSQAEELVPNRMWLRSVEKKEDITEFFCKNNRIA